MSLEGLELGMEPPPQVVPLPAAEPFRAAFEQEVGPGRVVLLPRLFGGDQLLEVGVVLHRDEFDLACWALRVSGIECLARPVDFALEPGGRDQPPDRQGRGR